MQAPIRGAVARLKLSRPQPAYRLRRIEREAEKSMCEAIYHMFAGRCTASGPGVDIDRVRALH